MRRNRGFSLIEMMVVLIIAAIGLFAITTLLYSTWKDWHASKSMKELQEDMDLAALTVKSVLEEAEWGDGFDGDITEDRTSITVEGKNTLDEPWTRRFYRSGSELRLQDLDMGSEYAVIKTLDAIAFYASDDKYPDEDDERHGLRNTLFVEIRVTRAGRTLDNQFFVRLRN